jgi:MOSC domain-containing protein YiiM
MAEGRVAAINVSDGGVPKVLRQSAWIDVEGVEGDRQRDRRIHGGPDRAVSLYSLELIEQLQAEGHPVEPGSMGENLTLAGIDWTLMVPGTRIEIGDAVLELTSFTSPCKNIGAMFTGGEFVRVSQKLNPGWSRVYARVLTPGRVAIGNRAVVSHPSTSEEPAL